MKDTIICDLDGTLFDINHRRHLVAKLRPDGTKNKRDFKAFEDAIGQDTVNEAVLALLISMCGWKGENYGPYEVVFVTGRHERTRKATTRALLDLPSDFPSWTDMHMRRDDDNRADFVVKQEILDTMLDKDRILFCLDDRNQVVDMWRRNGLTCFQVAEGNF